MFNLELVKKIVLYLSFFALIYIVVFKYIIGFFINLF